MAKRISNNHKIFEKAGLYLAGGVNSPVRSFKYVGGSPIALKKGRQAFIYDYDNKKYIDYVLSWGALILGHAHPQVIKEVEKAINSGFSFGTTTASEIELAKAITQAAPFIEQVRFVNSGTEAVMSAIRLARGYTKREKIIKFEHSYHGSADFLLKKAGSGLATLNIPSSAGVPDDFIKHTLVAPARDLEAVRKLFHKYGDKIAAVIVEPIGGNHGVSLPEPDFLKGLRQITKEYGALLVFDEVITGFRFRFGTAAEQLGIIPDLLILGKIIGGGLPIGAFAGSRKIMKHLAPEGKVYQASTFSGNPVVMRAGIATLNILKSSKNEYARIGQLTQYLVSSIKEEAEINGVELETAYYGSMFSLRFKEKNSFRRFYRSLLEEGVYFAPSEFEANFLSFAHTEKEIDYTLLAAKKALRRLNER